MNTCSACKYWIKVDEQYSEIPGIGICKNTPQLWDVTDWNEEYTGRIVRKEYSDKLAFVRDASDYRAVLYTLPAFGCVQFKEKLDGI